MRIASRFTIAVHIITAIEYFGSRQKVTSDLLALSVGVNPVIIRTVLSKLKAAGIVNTRKGSGDTTLAKPLEEITFYDVYKALDCVGETGLFHFHEKPNIQCPVGRNIHAAMDRRLERVQNSMEDELRKITLAEIAREIEQNIEAEGNG